MIKILLIFLSLSIPFQGTRVTAVAQKKSPLIETRRDRYADRTTISTAEITPLKNLMLTAYVSYVGKRPDRLDNIRILAVGSSSFWPTIDQRVAVGFIVDDGPALNYNAEYVSTFIVEDILSTSYGLNLSVDEFAAVACGRAVEMKIAHTEIRLKSKHVATLKALLVAAGGKCPAKQ